MFDAISYYNQLGNLKAMLTNQTNLIAAAIVGLILFGFIVRYIKNSPRLRAVVMFCVVLVAVLWVGVTAYAYLA